MESSEANSSDLREQEAKVSSELSKELLQGQKQKEEKAFLISYKNREGAILSGPLEVLWKLITGYEVDIFEVSLSRITIDFIDYMKHNNIPLEEESDFALMAARLLYYKSKLLLPNPAFEEEEEIIDQLPLELVEQLLEYKRFQMSSEYFKDLEEARHRTLGRKASWSEYEEGMEFLKIDLLSFLKAYQEFQIKEEKSKPMQIESEEVDLEEVTEALRSALRKSAQISFFNFIRGFSLLRLVASFFAVLEMTRLREIEIIQQELFHDIVISQRKAA